MRTGYAQLPLHRGKAPRWLFSKMVRLSREIVSHMVADCGPFEVLRRLSDPFWFQAFGCVLGFDWHSSGVTTTACGALKEAVRGLEKELGLWVAGGKGGTSLKTPHEVSSACEQTSCDPEPLIYASRMSAKVDSATVQDGYQLYHHSFFFTSKGQWCVVQQGMNDTTRMARRYHWLGEKITDFVFEPHAAICCNSRGHTLNLVAGESQEVRKTTAEISRQHPEKTLKMFERVSHLKLPKRHQVLHADINPTYLRKILLKSYERSPEDFETLLGIPGVGAKTLRALTLVSELIYGTTASTRDPARFSFAHGGKDGRPFPVDTETYEKTIGVLHGALKQAKVRRSEQVQAIKRLCAFSKSAFQNTTRRT